MGRQFEPVRGHYQSLSAKDKRGISLILLLSFNKTCYITELRGHRSDALPLTISIDQEVNDHSKFA